LSRRIIPEAEFRLSKLGFGGAAIGLTNYMGAYDAEAAGSRDAAIAAIRKAVALGVNYFDTAPGYGNGLSEELLGAGLEGVKTPLFLATKVFWSEPAKLRSSVEDSLRRLRRSSVDLMQLHGSSYTADQAKEILKRGGAAEQMHRMREEGLFNWLGFTTEDNNPGAYALIESGEFDAIQLAYNFILQHPYEPTRPFGSLLEAKKRGMLTVTMRTATSGIFQRWLQMVNPENVFDYTPALIQFVLSNRQVDVALVGMRTEKMVESCVEIWRDEGGRIDVDELWNRYEKAKDAS
jgi:aryl-alcohol dehydrogenase-like predicted oxidoreductase